MTFLELQNEVLSDRFDEAKRANAKNWINYRYGRLWGMEDWSFKIQVSDISVAANASTAPLGASIGPILTLFDSTVSPYFSEDFAIRPEDIYRVSSLNPGTPYNYTIIGTNIVFERPMLSARTFKVVNVAKFVPLSADSDVPAIPSEFHLLLSSGAASHGLRLENDPSWQAFEDEWSRGIEDMKKNYLSNARIYSDSLPSWP